MNSHGRMPNAIILIELRRCSPITQFINGKEIVDHIVISSDQDKRMKAEVSLCLAPTQKTKAAMKSCFS